MAKKKDENIVWTDRTHHMWFPISFSKYTIKNDRLYMDKGLFNTISDETLLYRIVDLKMKRTFLHKIFGTGDVMLYTKVDTNKEILLHNIKNPRETKDFISNLVEQVRNSKNVVGKEFFGGPAGGPDLDHDGIPDALENPDDVDA
ncbi:MAG: PH domain-containing protein [Lachnospiraceae bacterium]|nr:PH domain-containing protein [Lachnospiraceae bacterium]